jgi:hypothetical protein
MLIRQESLCPECKYLLHHTSKNSKHVKYQDLVVIVMWENWLRVRLFQALAFWEVALSGCGASIQEIRPEDHSFHPKFPIRRVVSTWQGESNDIIYHEIWTWKMPHPHSQCLQLYRDWSPAPASWLNSVIRWVKESPEDGSCMLPEVWRKTRLFQPIVRRTIDLLIHANWTPTKLKSVSRRFMFDLGKG